MVARLRQTVARDPMTAEQRLSSVMRFNPAVLCLAFGMQWMQVPA